MDEMNPFYFLPEPGHGNWPKDVYGDAVGAQMRHDTGMAQRPPNVARYLTDPEAFANMVRAQVPSRNVEDRRVEPPVSIPEDARDIARQGYIAWPPRMEPVGTSGLPNPLAEALGIGSAERFMGSLPRRVDPAIARAIQSIRRVR
jgi:hypothetical protein